MPKSWLLPVVGGAALPVDAPAHHPGALVAGPWAGLLILRRLVGRRDR